MTINEAITNIGNLKPHQYTDEQLTGWLSALDATLYNEIVKWHHGLEGIEHGPYYIDMDADRDLMAVDPYSELYVKYLAAQIDYWNGDMARYNNSMIMYNVAMQAYADYLNREYMPIQHNIVRTGMK